MSFLALFMESSSDYASKIILLPAKSLFALASWDLIEKGACILYTAHFHPILLDGRCHVTEMLATRDGITVSQLLLLSQESRGVREGIDRYIRPHWETFDPDLETGLVGNDNVDHFWVLL